MKEKNMEVLLTDSLSKNYDKFFDKFKEINILPKNEWKALHVLSYICSKYESYYNLKYTFKFNNVPSKSYEIFQVRKLSQMLSSDAEILSQYIDWVFETKIIQRKKRITSLGYFTHTDIVNEFKFSKLLNNNHKIDRATALPIKYIEIIKKYNLNINTYGDLSFMNNMLSSSDVDQSYKDLFQELKNNNFDFSLLDNIK